MRCQLIEESYASITSKKKKTGVDNLRNHLDDLGGLPPKRRPKTPDVIRKMVIFLTLMRPQLWDRNIIRREFKEFSNQDMLQEGALADKLLGKMMSGTLQTISRNAFKDALLNCWKSQAYAIPEFFQNLPEQVCDLYYLQVLLLHGCEKLVSLPKSFAKLVNLRHLDISDTPMLKKLPSGIGGMTRLQVLSKVIIEGSNRFNISKLKGMMELRGRLSIEGLHKVKDARQVEEFELHTKHLEDLVLEWSDVFDDSRNKENENEVFEKLKPHRMPKVVTIAFELFPSLEVLELEDMQSWENCWKNVIALGYTYGKTWKFRPLHGEVLQHLSIRITRSDDIFPTDTSTSFG
ncbi:putative disease resistance RPP13-like protein 1 [Tanacetum coccineum]